MNEFILIEKKEITGDEKIIAHGTKRGLEQFLNQKAPISSLVEIQQGKVSYEIKEDPDHQESHLNRALDLLKQIQHKAVISPESDLGASIRKLISEIEGN